jgi:hypothetical protein
MAAPQHLVQFGPYRFDGVSGQLWCHTQLVKLPPKAAAVDMLLEMAGSPRALIRRTCKRLGRCWGSCPDSLLATGGLCQLTEADLVNGQQKRRLGLNAH